MDKQKSKLEQHLPGLLIPHPTGGNEYEYHKKRAQLNQLKRKQPTVYNGLFQNIRIALDNLDIAAEQAGFMHVGFDEKGELIRYNKKR